MPVAELLALLLFAPLLAAVAAAVAPAAVGRRLAIASALLTPWLLWQLTQAIDVDGNVDLMMAGLALPLGIRLHIDGSALLLLWLVATVMLAATAHAATSIGATRHARHFWPAWLVLATALQAVVLSADLFNLYVGIELLTLSAVALVAFDGSSAALRAALRYLLVAMLASLAWLLGVALVFAHTGTLDLAQAVDRGGGALPPTALALMTVALLLKSAIFPLHGWLPKAHASSPGPVSAVLSALVVKLMLWQLYRLWFSGTLPPDAAGLLLAVLGAAAVIVGSLMALRQIRLKFVVAWSTVAQLGYLMLPFALPGAVAWQAAMLQVLSHGLAKAGMFLAAANIIRCCGSSRVDELAGADRRTPLSVIAFALAAVSLMGLPPSGGFLAKWLLLGAAWQQGDWWIVVVLAAGSLLAAAYLFRVLAAMLRPGKDNGPVGEPCIASSDIAALMLSALAVALGVAAAPVLERLPLPAALAGVGP